jgi:hypothetical protein
MSDFFIPASGRNTANISAAAAAASQPSEVFIALGESAKKANVVRDDFAVPILEVDEAIFDDFFGGRPQIVNKVVSQSIPAGTVVNEGTAVNLVMAPAREIPGLVFTGGHSLLKERTMAEVYDDFIIGNVEVNRMLSRRASPADLTDQDLEVIRTVAAQHDVTIGDQAGQTPEDVFVSWQLANTFAK